MSALILAQVAVDPAWEEAALAAAFLTAFPAAVGAVPPDALDQAVRFRRADPNPTTREIALLGEAVAVIRRTGPVARATGPAGRRDRPRPTPRR